VRLTVAGRGGGRVDAYLETGPGHPDPPAVPVGARVAVVGVYTRGGLGGGAGGDEVLLRSAADVEVRAAGFPADEGGWYSAAGLVVLVAAGAGWVVVLRRRVRRAAAEAERQAAERKRLEDQLRQAAKLEAVGRLAAGVAHDFNNLLAVINGCADLLKADFPAGSRAAGLATDIRDAGAFATALTVQLLAFGRPQPVAPHPLDLNAVVRDTARLLKRVIGGPVAVRQDLAPALRPAMAEPGLIGQILFNLAVNARDAMPAGGTLTIATGPGKAPEPGRPGGWVRLAVADTGEGMPEEVRARVFEPYFTTKPAGKGTGLGLAVVYGVVQSLGGRVWFTSEPGRGTRFEVELPAAEAPLPGVDESTPPPALAPAPPRPAGQEWPVVLLVEDDDGVRALARRLLEMRGLGVLAAGHPADALGLLASAGRVDVLLTDLLLPGMDGRELAERVRAARPDVRVVYMSGSLPADDTGPAGGFVLKPFTPTDLSAAVDAALAGAVPGERGA
ncbi:MAG: response regulator, partial [Gemmataceae bacterium]|nr:response regulator [Gemmataceae bacterium]